MTVPREKGQIGQAADRFSALLSGWFWWVFRKLAWAGLAFGLASVVLVVLFRFANPYLTYYFVSERMRLGEISRDWTPLEDFASVTARSVVAAEDANFCDHFGFDVAAIKAALRDENRTIGGSTISQQVAKNVFLWQGRTWLRKGLEVWFTVLIETFWPKARILEVYLNIAEFDEGVFGATEAGRGYFKVDPEDVSPLQAARMAAVLPSPKKRNAARPTDYLRKRTRQIISGARTIEADGRANCF